VTEVLATWQEQAAVAHSALVMVDLQNDFVDPQGWVARQQVPGFLGDTGIADACDRARVLLGAARAAGVLRVFVRMIGDDRYLSGPMQALYARNHGHVRPTCVQEGTWGADFATGLGPDGSPDELVVDKHRYSAFIGTRLDLLLRSHDIKTVVVCGVATTGCVESTIRDAFMLDHYVVIGRDACADYERHRHDAALSKLGLSFGSVVDVDDVAARWTGAGRRP
jgi:ureidoacrylate peracid hydrolase